MKGKRPSGPDHDLYNEPGKDKDPLQKWASVTTTISKELEAMSEPDEVLDKIDMAQRAIDHRRGLVDSAYLDLHVKWKIVPGK